MTDPRIEAALKAIEGATPGPFEIRGDDYAKRLEIGPTRELYAVGWSDNDDVDPDEAWANAERFALSPALTAALNLAATVWEQRRLRSAVIPQSVEHTRQHAKQIGESWASVRDALDAFLAALPQVGEVDDAE